MTLNRTDRIRAAAEEITAWYNGIMETSVRATELEVVKEIISRHIAESDLFRAGVAAENWMPIASAPVDTLIRIKEQTTNWVGTGIRKVYIDADNHTESYCQVLHYNGEVLVPAFYATHWQPLSAAAPLKDRQRMQEALDALPECPTEAEAEAALQACGTSGKEVVNGFIERLLRERSKLFRAGVAACVEKVKERLRYHESKSLTNGWSGNQSGPCCEKCVMRDEHFNGRADALKALVGCRNPFQIPEVCECHKPTREAVKTGVVEVANEIIRELESLTDSAAAAQQEDGMKLCATCGLPFRYPPTDKLADATMCAWCRGVPRARISVAEGEGEK